MFGLAERATTIGNLLVRATSYVLRSTYYPLTKSSFVSDSSSSL